jgi:hypothetical protein
MKPLPTDGLAGTPPGPGAELRTPETEGPSGITREDQAPAVSTGSDARATLLALAHRLQVLGADVDVQGTVVNRSIASAVTLHAMVGALAGLLWMVAPMLGALLVFSVAWSAYVELEGGRGWLRHFLLREVGHNLVVWGPREPKRQLVLCAPLDGPHTSVWADTRWFFPVLGGLALVALGMALWILFPTAAGDVVGAGTLVLLVAAALGTVGIAAYAPGNEPLGAQLMELVPRLRAQPPANLSVTLAATQGGSLAHDGLEILLRNNDHRLPARSTRVLVLTPGEGPVTVHAIEGIGRQTVADPILLHAIRALGVEEEEARGVSGASRAVRAGVQAVGLRAARFDTDWLEALIRKLDEASGKTP